MERHDLSCCFEKCPREASQRDTRADQNNLEAAAAAVGQAVGRQADRPVQVAGRTYGGKSWEAVDTVVADAAAVGLVAEEGVDSWLVGLVRVAVVVVGSIEHGMLVLREGIVEEEHIAAELEKEVSQ
jgi:hypothetical protein